MSKMGPEGTAMPGGDYWNRPPLFGRVPKRGRRTVCSGAEAAARKEASSRARVKQRVRRRRENIDRAGRRESTVLDARVANGT